MANAAAAENADYARDLSTISYERLGDLAMSADDPAAALTFFRDALEIRHRLHDDAPENADYARDLWISYSLMASSAEEHPGTEDARAWWLRAHEVLTQA